MSAFQNFAVAVHTWCGLSSLAALASGCCTVLPASAQQLYCLCQRYNAHAGSSTAPFVAAQHLQHLQFQHACEVCVWCLLLVAVGVLRQNRSHLQRMVRLGLCGAAVAAMFQSHWFVDCCCCCITYTGVHSLLLRESGRAARLS
jgi:hypothetical protein